MLEGKFSYAELLQVIALIKSAPRCSEIHLKFGDIEIDLSRTVPQADALTNAGPLSPASSSASSPAAPSPAGEPAVTTDVCELKPAASARQRAENTVMVRSPMVGTFYRAPSPDAPPFVEIGLAVEPDTTLCVIEVMKLMSSISAGTRGTITEIPANNGELVEYDQVLMVIESR